MKLITEIAVMKINKSFLLFIVLLNALDVIAQQASSVNQQLEQLYKKEDYEATYE